MKVLLDLPEETLLKFQKIADKEKRSRKVCMEIALIEYHKITVSVVKPAPKMDEPELSGYEAYESEITAAGNLEELETTGIEIEKDKGLSFSQKEKLKLLGKTIAKKFQ